MAFDHWANPRKTNLLGFGTSRKKPRIVSPTRKMALWDTLSHVCHVCHKRITRITDAELDHVKAYSKGGSSVKFAHRSCNRSKSNKSLPSAQKYLGVRVTVKRRKRSSKARPHKSSRLYKFDVGLQI